jgi:hypothetical protein
VRCLPAHLGRRLVLAEAFIDDLAQQVSDGGYSPGDTWELYVGSDGRVEEMAYHRGGSPSLEVFATWADYKKAGPLLFSLDRRPDDGLSMARQRP